MLQSRYLPPPVAIVHARPRLQAAAGGAAFDRTVEPTGDERSVARRSEVVRAVPRRPADAGGRHGAEAELRGADRRRARAAGARGIRDHARRISFRPSMCRRRDGVAQLGGRRERGIPAGADTSVSYTQAGFSLGWELDVWGRLRRLSEAARAQYLATEEARHGGHHDARRGRDAKRIWRCARSISNWRSRTRTRDVATNNLRLIEERRSERRGKRARRAPGRAAAVHGDGTDRRASSARSRRPRTR